MECERGGRLRHRLLRPFRQLRSLRDVRCVSWMEIPLNKQGWNFWARHFQSCIFRHLAEKKKQKNIYLPTKSHINQIKN